jgi:hypothetical protein
MTDPTAAATNAQVFKNVGNTVVAAVATQAASDLAATVDPSNQSILAQSGLSIQAFSYLTQGQSALTRMPAAQQKQVKQEVQNYLNKTGTDISTFQSQYKAYNDVVQSNISRAAQTNVFGNEVSQTVDQFVNDVGNDLGSINYGNVLKILAGNQVNDPVAIKYTADIQTMRNDLAGYYAASRGATSPENQDLISADAVIQNGLSSGGAKAFQEYIQANEAKTTNVVNNAVDNARQQVWTLFGVGDKYQSAATIAAQKAPVGSQVTVDGKVYTKTGTDSYDPVATTTNQTQTSDNSSEALPGSGVLNGIVNWFKGN